MALYTFFSSTVLADTEYKKSLLRDLSNTLAKFHVLQQPRVSSHILSRDNTCTDNPNDVFAVTPNAPNTSATPATVHDPATANTDNTDQSRHPITNAVHSDVTTPIATETPIPTQTDNVSTPPSPAPHARTSTFPTADDIPWAATVPAILPLQRYSQTEPSGSASQPTTIPPPSTA